MGVGRFFASTPLTNEYIWSFIFGMDVPDTDERTALRALVDKELAEVAAELGGPATVEDLHAATGPDWVLMANKLYAATGRSVNPLTLKNWLNK